jgi:predicted metal-dependent hydrolase
VATGRDNLNFDSVVFNGTTFHFSYCHSRRRTLGITVRPDKSLSVRVPLRTPVKEIRDFVTRRADWVIKVWDRLDARPAKQQQAYEDGALFLLEGRTFRLEIREDVRESVQPWDGRLLLSTPEPHSEKTIRTIIEKWYRRQAFEIIQERAGICHRMMQPEGIPLPPITIRSMNTRWGSYSYRTGRVTLNLNLIKAPLSCLDYVIIHELCHIRQRHHGPDFWALVERYVPDYRKIRKNLRGYVLL